MHLIFPHWLWLILGIALYCVPIYATLKKRAGTKKDLQSDDSACKSLKEMAEQDIEKPYARLHVFRNHAEFHYEPGLDPYIDVFVEFVNASVFRIACFGEISGHATYSNHPISAPPRIIENVRLDVGLVGFSVKHGEIGTLIIRQAISSQMADRMLAETSNKVPIKFESVHISFTIVCAGFPPKSFGWFGIPDITIDEARRV